MNISVGVSARHIHLNEEDFKTLFGKEKIEVTKELSQPGQFLTNLKVDLVTEKASINNVSLLGPLREYTQVELSRTDAFKLGLNPPVRTSGKLDGSERIKLIGTKGELILNEGVIIPVRHIHVNQEDLEKYGLIAGEYVKINIRGEKGGVLNNVLVKQGNFNFELHLDTDDANAHLIKNGDVVEVIK